MIRYHVSSRTGDPGICNALISCPFGSEADHFPTMAEARAESERRLGNENKDNQFASFHQPPPPGTDAQVSDGTEDSRIKAYYADQNNAAKFSKAFGIYEIQLNSVKAEGYKKGKPSRENLEKLYKMKKELDRLKEEELTQSEIDRIYSSKIQNLNQQKEQLPKVPSFLLSPEQKQVNTNIIIWEIEALAEKDARTTTRTLNLL